MVLHFEAVQLKHQLSVRDQLFVTGASMIAPAAKQALIPSAACFDIRNGDQWLRTHLSSVSTPSDLPDHKSLGQNISYNFQHLQPSQTGLAARPRVKLGHV